jgi:hypothetical protein
MAAPQQPKGQIANDHFRPGQVGERDVGDQNCSSVAHIARLVRQKAGMDHIAGIQF